MAPLPNSTSAPTPAHRTPNATVDTPARATRALAVLVRRLLAAKLTSCALLHLVDHGGVHGGMQGGVHGAGAASLAMLVAPTAPRRGGAQGRSSRPRLGAARLSLRPAPLPPLWGAEPPRTPAPDSDEWARLAATSEWLATPTSWTTLTTNLLGAPPAAQRAGHPEADVPPFDVETLQAAADFFDALAVQPRRLDWWRKLLPANVYASINTAFFAFAGESRPPLLGRQRTNATTRLLAADVAKREASWTQVRSYGSPASWAQNKTPHCRWFIAAEQEGVGMTEEDIKAEGFLYWTTATCSCFYTYWAQSAGTFMPIPIWDYMGWQESFWTMHRFPIKIICGLTYFLLRNIGVVVMFFVIWLFAIFYGFLQDRLARASWEWGVTQSWNAIPAKKEEELDSGVLQEKASERPGWRRQPEPFFPSPLLALKSTSSAGAQLVGVEGEHELGGKPPNGDAQDQESVGGLEPLAGVGPTGL